jgi:hypothetical protein
MYASSLLGFVALRFCAGFAEGGVRRGLRLPDVAAWVMLLTYDC